MIDFDKATTKWSPLPMTGAVTGPLPIQGIHGTHANPQDFGEMKCLAGTRPFKFRHDGRLMMINNARCYLEPNKDGTVAEFTIGTAS